MAVLYISEFQHRVYDENLPAEPSTDQTVAIGAGSVQSSAFQASTRLIRIAADAVCSIAVGPNPTATATKRRIAANAMGEYFVVQPGWKVAVITNT